ncbi:RagB/SusD family nutrient uptake outer membrane protein [Mucilaginibacter robiniae]|uniref:RagB/SusD family nutrient uptake outer membrane protein n=1 Tax=Mucilaginibacter robiniae TaxID=2728022 RepID=A0A7L5E6P6_9SPHI|nr:RagB/SusD family nutrient uptake outer membrane protein [Mucilaginibacter robiniae]QJD96523.1 RagB/SusD family nutrient uptake outer membrane protein [Mucilaginibacter robiniae]
MKKKFLIILGIALLGSTACQKSKLYPVSQTSISNQDGQPFSTSARIQSQVLGLYATMRSGQLYGGRYEVYEDVKGENWINSTSNSVTAYQTWTETVSSTSSEVLNLWSQAYLTINNCNLFIDGMASTGTAVVGAATSAQYVAEAKFIRAAAYYALLQFYCQPYVVNNGASPGVPLRLTGNSAYGNYDLAPVTVAQVYAQIISDLNGAETGLPLVYYTTGTTTIDAASNTTRAHRNTAIAFKTRVYLSMQQYANVITEANKIVSSAAPFTATTGYPNALQANEVNMFKANYTNTEYILAMPFNANETPGTQNQIATYFSGLGSSEFYLNPNGIIADATWKSTDTRRSLITVKSGRSYQLKFPTSSPYTDWVPVMRYAEVVLNLAEARARTSGIDAQSIALLNAIRGRNDATTVYTASSFSSANDLINAILKERNIEFLGEGLRWSDLMRLNLPIPAKSNVPQVNPTDASYIWPMSGNEQLYNKLIGR